MTFRGFVKWGRRFRRADGTDCGSMSSERSSLIRGKAGSDAGAAMVEMAMVFSLLIMLLVGTVTAAIAFGENNSIENSAREASRFGATLPGPVDTGWLQSVRDVARAAAQGALDPGAAGQYICVAFINGASTLSLTDTGGVEAYPGTECFSDGLPTDELRVQVVTQTDATIEAVLFSTDVTLSAPAAARYERS
jgi:Flp pilus assembly protein TadG